MAEQFDNQCGVWVGQVDPHQCRNSGVRTVTSKRDGASGLTTTHRVCGVHMRVHERRGLYEWEFHA